jgi:hypothetical protein
MGLGILFTLLEERLGDFNVLESTPTLASIHSSEPEFLGRRIRTATDGTLRAARILSVKPF